MSQSKFSSNWGWHLPFDFETIAADQCVENEPPKHLLARLLSSWTFRRAMPIAFSMLTDLLLLVAGMWGLIALAGTYWPGLLTTQGQLNDAVAMLAFGVFLRLTMGAWSSIYPGYGWNPAEKLSFRGRTWAIVSGLMILWALSDWSERQLAVWIQLSLLPLDLILLPIAQSWLREVLIKCNSWGRPVAVIAEGETGRRVLTELQNQSKYGFFPAYILSLDESLQIQNAQHSHSASSWSSFRRSSQCLCTCIIATSAKQPDDVSRLRRRVSFLLFRRVLWVDDSSQISGDGRSVCWIGRQMATQVRRNLANPINMIAKRIFDLLVAIPVATVVLPVIGLAAMAIKIIDPKGPIFYIQQREGINGHHFGVWKLRTMCVDAEDKLEQLLASDSAAHEEWQRCCKLQNDPRILPVVGHFLRKFSIDELPQVLQVILGDMSIVGPRPFPQYHTAQYASAFRSLRRTTKPGLTGLWQVEVRSDGDIEMQEFFDTQYIENWSLWLDFHILMRTVPAVLRGDSAC